MWPEGLPHNMVFACRSSILVAHDLRLDQTSA
jgi:hypothetical protein